MKKINTFLWFDGNGGRGGGLRGRRLQGCEEGEVRDDARLVPDPKWRGKVIMASMRLNGQEFVALNAGLEL